MKAGLSYFLLTTVICLHLRHSCYAQENLIQNGSFEELQPNFLGDTLCPSNGGAIGLAKHWSSARGTCDYFNSCSNEIWPNFGVPQNMYGYQMADDGSAYAMLASYSTLFENAREYLWQELPQVLLGGQGYKLSFRVSLPDSVNFAINSIGGLLTIDDTRYWENADFLNAGPQVESDPLTLMDDKEGWTTVSGSFVAVGGEKYLTIGTFKRDNGIWIERVDSFPHIMYNWESSSYYIDGVELYEDNSIGIAEQEREVFNLWPNPTNGQVYLSYEREESRTLQWEITDLLGRRVHLQPLQGNRGNAILGVRLPAGMYVSNLLANDVRIGSHRLVVL